MVSWMINSRPRGLTLIEVLIVITIIGILAGMILPNLMKKPDQARIIAPKQDISTILQALEIYKLDNYSYPSETQGLQSLITKPIQETIAANWAGPYLKKIPTDPWGNLYQYNVNSEDDVNIISFGADNLEGGEGINADIFSSGF